MKSKISKDCADFLRSSLLSTYSTKLKATHARELIAALFGYKSHAALLADNNHSVDDLRFAELLVPDIRQMDRRRNQLNDFQGNLPNSMKLASEVCDFLKQSKLFNGNIWLYESLEDYITDVFLQDEDSKIIDDLSGVMAETNAYFDDPYYEEAVVTNAKDSVTVLVTGQYNGVLDQDRPYCGHQIDMSVAVELVRAAGKAAFMAPDISASGSVIHY